MFDAKIVADLLRECLKCVCTFSSPLLSHQCSQRSKTHSTSLPQRGPQVAQTQQWPVIRCPSASRLSPRTRPTCWGQRRSFGSTVFTNSTHCVLDLFRTLIPTEILKLVF